jgi:O-antigen biosynthesis protein
MDKAKANQGSLLNQANQAFREKNYALSLRKYLEAIGNDPLLSSIAHINIKIAKARLHKIPLDPIPTSIPVLKRGGPTRSSHKGNNNNICMFDLVPGPNVISTAAKNEWVATKDDPHFQICSATYPLIKAGFYRLRLKLIFADTFTNSALYVDYGEGLEEANSFRLPLESGTENSRIVYLPKSATGLRFDPIEHQGHFTLQIFELKRLDKATAIKEIKTHLKSTSIHQGESFDNQSHLFSIYDQNYSFGKGAKADYRAWIRLAEEPSLPTDDELNNIRQMHIQPLFSVIVPVYNTDERHLRECIESVLNQSYSKLELCIADDNSSKPYVKNVLDEYSKKDGRVKAVKRMSNGHISNASNSALEVATGDFIALLDHDDIISKHALFYATKAINQNPSAKIFYSDEDKIDGSGNRSNPHFKSDWNPDLFFSINYVSHLGIYKAEIIKEVGGFRVGVEGSQDQDLLLRCLPYVKHHEIIHIPRVLYHWRMIPGSTALASGEKSYTSNAGVKALTDYFKANGPDGVSVEKGILDNTYKVNWPMPRPEPLVSLMIPTRDRMQITQLAVDSILKKTNYNSYEIIILDNGSIEEGTLAWFAEIQKVDRRVKVLRYDHPFNYSAINNFGVKHANGSIVGLVNNDIEVISPSWLTEMVSHAVRPDIGCVGAKLHYGNGKIQHGGVILGIGGVACHSHKMFPEDHPGYFGRLASVQNLSAVTAAALLVRKKLYNQVGGLNDAFLQVAFNDVDFCLRVCKAGYRNLWTPYARLYHHESISRGSDDTPDKYNRFAGEVNYMMKAWGDVLQSDPYYNPNLSKIQGDFSIALKHK